MNNLIIKKIKSNAKINLFLRIIKKVDEYWKIQTLIIPYKKLWDDIIFHISINKLNKITKIIYLKSNIKLDKNFYQKNSILQAISYLRKKFRIENNIKIYLKKRIPLCSGLGGGSSNFYFTLDTILKTLKININSAKVKKICNKFSLDAFFFKFNKPCLIQQPENKVKIISKFAIPKYKLIFNKEKCKTKIIFNKLKNNFNKDKNRNKYLLIYKNIKNNKKIKNKYWFNDLDDLIYLQYPKLKKTNKNNNNVIFTGSGSTFIIFDS